MVEKQILKQIHFLKDLSDDILENLGRIATLENFDEEDVLFRQNQKQMFLYMLVSGKVFLSSRSFTGKSLTLDEVKPGRTFGVPALFDQSSGTFTAICAIDSTMVTISGERLQALFEQDFRIGHIFMRKIVEMFKIRREMHTRQFMHSLKTHPEISKFQA
ncbi:MAG: Crp/Fnr family transcriptional regulator [Pseudomonadota bacterium]